MTEEETCLGSVWTGDLRGDISEGHGVGGRQEGLDPWWPESALHALSQEEGQPAVEVFGEGRPEIKVFGEVWPEVGVCRKDVRVPGSDPEDGQSPKDGQEDHHGVGHEADQE